MWKVCLRLPSRAALALSALALSAGLAAAQPAVEYEIGGPLAGVKLPPMPTQYGEPPGYPGNAKEGQPPELLLYPGAVERYVAYMTKYCPVRPAFDRQSQLKNWVAPQIPSVTKDRIEQYAAPLYTSPKTQLPKDTGKRWTAVPVVRCKPDAPAIALDLGELAEGMYCVRVIGAVETEKLKPIREPLIVRFTVNDGLAGETGDYRLRIGYCDEFFPVAELYFHAPVKRRYQATLQMDARSAVDLLVHNITLDDALAGTVRRAIKTRPTLDPEMKPRMPTPSKLPPEERLARDAALWNGFPPLNVNSGGIPYKASQPILFYPSELPLGTPQMAQAEIETALGKWQGLYGNGMHTRWSDPARRDALLINPQLKIIYTMEDLKAHRPLPDPYPYKDDGTGLVATEDGQKGWLWAPIADEVGERYRYYTTHVAAGFAKEWRQKGDADLARDGAVALIRYAYSFPGLSNDNALPVILRDPGPYGRDWRFRRRVAEFHWGGHYASFTNMCENAYEPLFDYIKGNEELAQSIHRFVPWVKTSEDVIKLIDVYLVQTTAKRIMRYHYLYSPTAISKLAGQLGDESVTGPWMEWLFTKTFFYPMPLAGIQDLMITNCDANGCNIGNGGSSYYVCGEGAMAQAEELDLYSKASGDTRYALSDPAKYAQPLAQCYWHLDMLLAGGTDWLRVGDVSGPDKPLAYGFPLVERAARNGWRWSQDPKFAFVLKECFGRKMESDEEWAAIEKAAQTVARAPWLDARSRVMPMWAGILESGQAFDDPRFHRAAAVRVGYGQGHHHFDTLDLQVVAHGLPATAEGGQRMGYTSPPDEASRVHNTVEVDGQHLRAYSRVFNLTDDEGARYLAAEARISPGQPVYRRQVALIDVDEGQGAQAIPRAQQKPGVKRPAGATTPNSYVFDCFRIAGGRTHTYCFHGTVEDEFTWNALNEQPVGEAEGEAKDQGYAATVDPAVYLSSFVRSKGQKFSASAPATLQATWRLSNDPKMKGSEAYLMGKDYDAAAPRKFTRLHLLDAEGATILRAPSVSKYMGYQITNIMAMRRTEAMRMESVFTALIEPYAGEPFLASQRMLPIAANETDALRAVAVEVKTVNGHTDLCFADGRPDKTRVVTTAAGKHQMAGEFAFLSTDAHGLRQVALTGGTLLEGPGVRVALATRERTATITRVDYRAKKFWIDQAWPACSAARPMDVGYTPKTSDNWNRTSVSPVIVKAAEGGSEITDQRGADFYRSPILALGPSVKQPERMVAECSLALGAFVTGTPKGWIASDDAMTRFWRAEFTGEAALLAPNTGGAQPGARWLFPAGAGITPDTFGKANVLRLWLYGVGDDVRQATSFSARRVEAGAFEVRTDVDAKLSLRARALQVSTDRTTWQPARGNAAAGWCTLDVAPSAEPIYVKAAQ